MECPVKKTVDLIGNKWKLLIIQQLISSEKRYGELKRAIPEISSKVLTENLKMLEEDDIISREEIPGDTLHVVYRLSELGNNLLPIIDEMRIFGETYMMA